MRHPLGFSFGPAAGESPGLLSTGFLSFTPSSEPGSGDPRSGRTRPGRLPILWGSLRQRLASPLLAASLSGHPSLPAGP